MKRIDSRSHEILLAVVTLHIETGRPVSSGLVQRYLARQVSSATIRAVMQGLEKDGYLRQPHTSSGRLPTDAGFRVLVDSLRAGWSLRRWETPADMHRLLEMDMDRTVNSPDRIKSLAGLLCRLTDNIGIILGPSWDLVPAVRVELYPRSSRRVLMVVILENAMVHTGMVDLSRSYTEPVIAEAGRILSERIAGRTVAEIRAGALDHLDLQPTPATKCAQDLVQQGMPLMQELEHGDVELEGVARVLEEPEFHDPEPLKALLHFLASPRRMREALDQLANSTNEEVSVWIGQENPVSVLRRFSLLTVGFDLDGRDGVLAVLGPRRMSYQRVFHGMDVLRRTLAAH